MNKIALVGSSGSGKSTVSRRLAQRTGLPLFHMDTIFWKGNWEAVPEAEYLDQHRDLVRKDSWIIEGYIDEKMHERLTQADLILYLDYSGLRCCWHVFQRWLKHRKTSRPELPPAALESLGLQFMWLVFTRAERKDIEAALRFAEERRVIRARSPRQLERYIAQRWG